MHIKPLPSTPATPAAPPAGKPAPAAAAGDFSQLLKTAQATGTSPTPTSGS